MASELKRFKIKILLGLLAFCLPMLSYGAKSSTVRCQLVLSLSTDSLGLLNEASKHTGLSLEQVHDLYFQSKGYTSSQGWMEVNDSAAIIIATTAAISKKSPAEIQKIFATKLRFEDKDGFYRIPESMAATLTAYQIIKKLNQEQQFEKFNQISSNDRFSLKPFLELLNSI